METTMGRDSLLPRWSSLAFRGVASIVFGILAFAWPGITLTVLALLFGAYAFVDGVTALVVAVQRGAHRWLLVVDGLLGIGAGIVALFWPGITLLALVLIIGIRFIIMGAFQIAAAIRLHRELHTPVLYGLAGLASLVLGVLAFVVPQLTALVLVLMLGAYAFAFGIVLLALAFRMRRVPRGTPTPAPA